MPSPCTHCTAGILPIVAVETQYVEIVSDSCGDSESGLAVGQASSSIELGQIRSSGRTAIRRCMISPDSVQEVDHGVVFSNIPNWEDPRADIPDTYEENSEDDFTDMDEEGRTIARHVRVKILSLEWGGEYISNPCQHAFGCVIDMILDGRHGNPSFVVDFGRHLGIQIVPVNDCHPWTADVVTPTERAAVERVLLGAKGEPLGVPEMLGNTTGVLDNHVTLPPTLGSIIRDEDNEVREFQFLEEVMSN